MNLWNLSARKFRLPPAKPGEQNPFVAHFPARVSRYVTLWWWDCGPITKLPRGQVAFWERLNTDAPKSAKPFCLLLNTVKFSSKPRGQGKQYRECQHYDVNGLSPHLFGDSLNGTWYEAMPPWIVWRRGYWWAVFEGRKNTTLASLWNKAWENR